jgi:hypothetical protein
MKNLRWGYKSAVPGVRTLTPAEIESPLREDSLVHWNVVRTELSIARVVDYVILFNRARRR